jgi:peptidoglycan hydrolase CwlO-like protein
MAEKAVGGSLGTLKKAIQLALGPDLETIKKDLTDLKNEVRVIGVKQEEMDKRLNNRIEEMDKRLNNRIEEMHNRNTIQFESLRKCVESS